MTMLRRNRLKAQTPALAAIVLACMLIPPQAVAEFKRLPGESYSDYSKRYQEHVGQGSETSTEAPADSKESVKNEIIARCRDSMGRYGASIVKSCVDQDIDAYIKLVPLQQQYRNIVDRCLSSMKKYGYSIVHSCAEQDIEAEKALRNY